MESPQDGVQLPVGLNELARGEYGTHIEKEGGRDAEQAEDTRLALHRAARDPKNIPFRCLSRLSPACSAQLPAPDPHLRLCERLSRFHSFPSTMGDAFLEFAHPIPSSNWSGSCGLP